MRKIALLMVVSALLAPAVFAAPTDEEVEAAFTGVFTAYGALFLTSMMGQTITGVTMDMNMESGESALHMENVDVEALFTAIGETMDGTDDMPEITFTHLSGAIISNSEGEMNMDVTLKGSSVNRLEMQIINEELVQLKANGKNYDYLKDAMNF